MTYDTWFPVLLIVGLGLAGLIAGLVDAELKLNHILRSVHTHHPVAHTHNVDEDEDDTGNVIVFPHGDGSDCA